MQSNSTTVTLARVTRHIREQCGGTVTYAKLVQILHEFGVHQNAAEYIDKLVVWKWLRYDCAQDKTECAHDMYRTTPESEQTATITITMPRLLAKETYNDIVARYGRYSGIIEIGEVPTNED